MKHSSSSRRTFLRSKRVKRQTERFLSENLHNAAVGYPHMPMDLPRPRAHDQFFSPQSDPDGSAPKEQWNGTSARHRAGYWIRFLLTIDLCLLMVLGLLLLVSREAILSMAETVWNIFVVSWGVIIVATRLVTARRAVEFVKRVSHEVRKRAQSHGERWWKFPISLIIAAYREWRARFGKKGGGKLTKRCS